MTRPTASAPPKARRGFAEHMLRGIALTFMSILLFYLKVLTGVVRLGIEAVKKARRADAPQ